MPIILALFCLLPLAAGVVLEYVVCRFPRRKAWRLLPPCAVIALAALIGVGRYNVWTSPEVSPWTQLVIFPGLPALFLLLGLLLGWRWWKRRWSPRVIKDK